MELSKIVMGYTLDNRPVTAQEIKDTKCSAFGSISKYTETGKVLADIWSDMAENYVKALAAEIRSHM